MPLAVAPLNTKLKVIKILGDDLRGHLENLNLNVDDEITILSIDNDNLVCLVANSKIVIDKNSAIKILVA